MSLSKIEKACTAIRITAAAAQAIKNKKPETYITLVTMAQALMAQARQDIHDHFFPAGLALHGKILNFRVRSQKEQRLLSAARTTKSLSFCINFTTVHFTLQDFFASIFRFFFLLYTTPSLNFSFQLLFSGSRAMM